MGLRELEGSAPSQVDGFEVGWRDSAGEHRRLLSEAVSVAFEEGGPVRGFPSYRGQRHFPGLYWSATTGGHVGFESWLERDHVMLLDFTPEVTGLLSQPFWLFWEDGRGKRVSHAPDYFARFEDGRGLVVDCRPLDRIDARSAADPAWRALRAPRRWTNLSQHRRTIDAVHTEAEHRLNVPTLREKLRFHAFSNDALFRWTDSLGRSLMLVTTPDDYDALRDESHQN